MSRWLRRLRGILRTGVAWGVAGTAVGAGGGLLAGVFAGAPLLSSMVEFGLGAGGLGFLLGGGFAGFLTLMDGRRTLADLSPGRAALWGALAGVALPLSWILFFYKSVGSAALAGDMLTVLLAACVSYGTLSAGLAAGTVWLAKRAPDELPGRDELNEPAWLIHS